MLAHSFNRNQVAQLSGLSYKKLRTLEQKYYLPSTYTSEMVVVVTIYKSLLELFDRPVALKMLERLVMVVKCGGKFNLNDCYLFETWNDFQINYQKLSSIGDWESNRWCIRLMPQKMMLSDNLVAEVKLSPQGNFEVLNILKNSLVCICLRGIYERIEIAAEEDCHLYNLVAEYLNVFNK